MQAANRGNKYVSESLYINKIPYWPLFNRPFLAGLFFNQPYGHKSKQF